MLNNPNWLTPTPAETEAIMRDLDNDAILQEQGAFWIVVNEGLIAIERQIDARGAKTLQTGNVPCGLFFTPSGEWASKPAFIAFTRDARQRRFLYL